MTEDQSDRMTAGPKIDYEALAQDAMRGIVRAALVLTAKNGLPGDHHFYISFDTQAPGVSMSRRLKEKYPHEMTIVLQHRFWDLAVSEERFEVKLTFDGIPERLVIPFASIKLFFDPSVRYGLQFEEAADITPDAGEQQMTARALGEVGLDGVGTPRQSGPRPSGARKARTPRKPRADKEPPAAPQSSQQKPATSAEQPRPEPASEPAAAASVQKSSADAEDGDAKVVSLDAFRKK